jgi:hypothetical protein
VKIEHVNIQMNDSAPIIKVLYLEIRSNQAPREQIASSHQPGAKAKA